MAASSRDHRPAPGGPAVASLAHRLDRARYRARQFIRGLRPHLSPREIAEVRALLSERELALFLATDARDRRHSVDLMHLLRREAAEKGHAPPRELLVAALVHDVGKGRLQAWHRVAFVLLDAWAPGLAERVGRDRGPRWQRALWRLRHHARLGADLLREGGTNPRVIEFVAAHTSPPPDGDPEIRSFIEADGRV